MKLVNCTPHLVRLNNGTEIPPSGTVARVQTKFTEFDMNNVCRCSFGEVMDLPPFTLGTLLIVSAMVAQAVPDRCDVVAPATGHPLAVRENGLTVSVPGFVKY